MPELPEVETIKNDVRALVIGRTILDAAVTDERVVRFPTVADFVASIAGTKIKGVERRAKYLLIGLNDDLFLVVQLMVTGQLLLQRPHDPLQPATRLVLRLDGGEELRLVDNSHFAKVHLVTWAELAERLPLDDLGPEIISDEFTLADFEASLAGRRRQIKALLLDQRVVSGIGSIYADEALFAARIHPASKANAIPEQAVADLYRALRRIVVEAIRLRGTTTRWYRDVLGRKGRYQERLEVVGKAGEPCGATGCSGSVVREIIGGKETYLCPGCQRLYA